MIIVNMHSGWLQLSCMELYADIENLRQQIVQLFSHYFNAVNSAYLSVVYKPALRLHIFSYWCSVLQYVFQWLPTGCSGHLLFTTRCSIWCHHVFVTW